MLLGYARGLRGVRPENAAQDNANERHRQTSRHHAREEFVAARATRQHNQRAARGKMRSVRARNAESPPTRTRCPQESRWHTHTTQQKKARYRRVGL